MLGKKNEKVEFVDSKVEREEIKGFSVRGMLDGSLLAGKAFARQLPFILFLTFLAILYIGNRLHAEKLVRRLESSREEARNMRAEQITTASELMKRSMPSAIEDLVEQRGLGLKQPTSPPYKIIVEE